jgi:hypothetical protein
MVAACLNLKLSLDGFATGMTDTVERFKPDVPA